jgi:hypothetical protein
MKIIITPPSIFYTIQHYLKDCFKYSNHHKGDWKILGEASKELLSLAFNLFLKNNKT